MGTIVERQAAILRAIVREYIRTGEPVGSKYLVDRARMPMSSATVRSEMARLEELGYLSQPHASSGRVPTDSAYRFVVDEIRTPPPLGAGQRQELEEEMGGEPASVDVLMHRASDVISRFTRHAAAILSHRERSACLRRIELFSTGPSVAMIVVITENGRVEQRMVSLEHDMDARRVDALAERLARDVQGAAPKEAIGRLTRASAISSGGEKALIDAVSAAVESLSATGEQVVVGGVANLAGEQDFARGTLQRLYEAIEHHEALLDLFAMAQGGPITVRIGSEMAAAEFRSCSVVVAGFQMPGDASGSVGVIGPTRMDYRRVIATANAVARALEHSLGGSGAPV